MTTSPTSPPALPTSPTSLTSPTVASVPTLNERLGLAPDARAVIITCLDLGQSHAANVGVYDSLRGPVATTASIMVPCPWAREAASRFRGEDVGVQLTLNAEHSLYRWGPITHAPSLLDGNGGFPVTRPDLWDHADLDEVRRECRAQIERAIVWGFDVTHLTSHWDAMILRPEFFDVLLDMAVEFSLPLHLPSADEQRNAGFDFRLLAAEEGILFPDRSVEVGAGAQRSLENVLFTLEPGVTELRMGPCIDTPELRALTTDWAKMVEQHDVLVDPATSRLLDRAGVFRVGYRQLRTAQRLVPTV
jgi:chitin disaccharide deacetylase